MKTCLPYQSASAIPYRGHDNLEEEARLDKITWKWTFPPLVRKLGDTMGSDKLQQPGPMPAEKPLSELLSGLPALKHLPLLTYTLNPVPPTLPPQSHGEEACPTQDSKH